MSTVDEVLATAEVVDAVCVIDGETRIISVPNEYKELGVESDEKVTRIKFQCPKIVGDNVDLTEYNLYINYRNAGNKLNSYLVEDATVTGDVINFSWLLSRHVTESPGTISYIVCAKKSDYTGVINEWNTKVATGTVGIGLEATEEIEEQNIDAIEQILRSIVELENKFDSLSEEIGNYIGVEPAEDDIPKVFFGGALQQTKDAAVVPFRYISKTQDIAGYAEIKAQGNSSMSYPKKNQTVKLFKDADCTEKLNVDFKGWGKQNKHVYKANWIDLSHARNVVSARIWADVVKSRTGYDNMPELLRTSPNQGAVDGFPVKVYAAGVYQGRYTLNIPKDKWMANMDDALETHCILCGENYASGCFRAAASINGRDWTDEIHDIVPDSIKTRWNEVISFVMNSTDDEFVAGLGNYFYVDSLIDYHLFGLASCGLDAYGKNQIYMTYDGQKWIASMYDMDSTWGLLWTGASFVATDYDRAEYQDFKDGEGNLLYIRLEQLFYEELQYRWAELKNGALSINNIINRFERFTDIASADLVKEDYASTTGGGKFTGIPSQSTNNIQQIRAYALARQAYVDEYVAALTPSVEVPCTGITLDQTELTLTESGNQTLTATVTPENTTDKVVWESSDVSVATVSDGIVTTVGNGSATITATCGEYSASCSVSVSGISGDVDYTINPLADVTWLEGQKYALKTGVLGASTNEHCTTKFRLQNCVYNLTISGGSYLCLYMWDDSGTYVGYYEVNGAASMGKFTANPNWQYAIKFYTTSTFDASAVTLMPVDNTSNAAQTTQLTFNMADFDWTNTNNGSEINIHEKFTGAGFTSVNSINKTNGHHVFLFNASTGNVYNNAPVFTLFSYGNQYLLSVIDSNADFVKGSGWTLVLN